MAQQKKILGQQAAGIGGTEAMLYTVPTGKSTLVSSITVANRGATDTTFRIAAVPAADAGGATATKHYIAYDLPAYANDTYIQTIGITLASGDQLRVTAGNGNVTFNAFGVEG